MPTVTEDNYRYAAGNNPNCVLGAEGCNCAVRNAEIRRRQAEVEINPIRYYSTRNEPFFGVSRTVAPHTTGWNWRTTYEPYRLRDINWDEWSRGLDYSQTIVDEAANLPQWLIEAALTGAVPAPDTWPTFLANWGAVGLQHERRVNCQPLLSA